MFVNLQTKLRQEFDIGPSKQENRKWALHFFTVLEGNLG